jgi:hypothetical protein
MVCGTFTLTQIGDGDVNQVVDLFQKNNPPPLRVTKNHEPDGTWTVVAVFPPCPANTTHSTDNKKEQKAGVN